MEEICGDTGCRRRSESIAQRLRVGLEKTRIIRVADPGAGMRARPPTARLRRVCVHAHASASASACYRWMGNWRRVRACLCLISTRCCVFGGVWGGGGGCVRGCERVSGRARDARGGRARFPRWNMRARVSICITFHLPNDRPTHPPTDTHTDSLSNTRTRMHACLHTHGWMDGWMHCIPGDGGIGGGEG